jgi:environmental stress-induced protein Ves
MSGFYVTTEYLIGNFCHGKKMKSFTKDRFNVMPWKNGGGITTELYRLNMTHQLDYDFRLSVATINQSGPFSLFPEIDRHLVLLKGDGVSLTLNSKNIILTQNSEALTFKGEDSIFCTLLSGAVIDFNVMINRHWGRAHVKKSTGRNVICEGDFTFIYSLASETLIVLEKSEKTSIEGECIRVDVFTSSDNTRKAHSL